MASQDKPQTVNHLHPLADPAHPRLSPLPPTHPHLGLGQLQAEVHVLLHYTAAVPAPAALQLVLHLQGGTRWTGARVQASGSRGRVEEGEPIGSRRNMVDSPPSSCTPMPRPAPAPPAPQSTHCKAKVAGRRVHGL